MENVYPDKTLRDYVRVIFRHKWLIVVTVISVAATVFVGLKFQTPVYEAQVKMLISSQKQVESPFYQELLGGRSTKLSLTQSEIVKSNAVIEMAVTALKLHQLPLDYETRFASPIKRPWIEAQVREIKQKIAQLPPNQQQTWYHRRAVNQLRNNIAVEPVRDTDLFVIRVRDFSPVGAAIMANAISRSYVIFDLEQQLAELQQKYGEKHLSVRQLRDNIERMQKTLSGEPLTAIDAIGPASVKIVEQASIPLERVGESEKKLFIIALAVSVLVGIILAFLFDYLDQTVRTPHEASRFLNVSHLGSIPKKPWWRKGVIQNPNQRGAYPLAYQALADQLYVMMKERQLKSVLLTAALKSEGTTTAIANLGSYLARRTGKKVLVIETNFRDPGLHKLLKLPAGAGLADLLSGKAELDQAIRGVEGSFAVLPAGNTGLNPVALLDSPKMADVLRRAGEHYDLILLDGANLKDFKDSAVVSSYVDGIALIVREGMARRQVIKMSLSSLEQAKAKILGMILNSRTFAIPKVIYDLV